MLWILSEASQAVLTAAHPMPWQIFSVIALDLLHALHSPASSTSRLAASEAALHLTDSLVLHGAALALLNGFWVRENVCLHSILEDCRLKLRSKTLQPLKYHEFVLWISLSARCWRCAL